MSILRSVALVAFCVLSQSIVGCSGNEVTTPPATQPTPKKYLLTWSNQSPVAGSSVTITAQLVDAASNAPLPISGRVVSWSDLADQGSFASPISTTSDLADQGSFANPISTTDVGGKATVAYTTTTRAEASHKIVAIDGDGSRGASDAVVTIAGPPAKYRMGVIAPVVVVAGGTVSVSASLFDVNDDQVRVSGRVVTWTSSGTGGSFSAATSLTDKDGSVTVYFRTSATGGVTHVVTAVDSSGFKGSTNPIVTVGDDEGPVSSVLRPGG